MKTIKYYSESFKGKTTKEAYLKASNWFGKNILSKDILKNSLAQYKTDKENKIVTIEIYATLEEHEINESFCKRCKEFYTSFFVQNSLDCSQCKVTAYKNQVEEKLKIKKSYRQELLRQRNKKE